MSADEEDMKHSSNSVDNRTIIDQESSVCDHDSNIKQVDKKHISSTTTKTSSNYPHQQFNDDVKIIDLESRVEESISSYGRSTSDSTNQTYSPVILNGIPSNSASSTDPERESSSPLSDNSSTCSPTESPPRYIFYRL